MYNLLDSVCTMVGMAAMCSTRTRKVRRGSRGEEIISVDGLSVNSIRKETIHKVTQQHYYCYQLKRIRSDHKAHAK